ncbi:hypothetical protein [Kaistella sp.]|uniref:hypothetical protein n=1 Tax=Kaistella sp. TaxID=2782235 RepID=UPI00359FC513
MKKLILFAILFVITDLQAQSTNNNVGINTTNPTENLDVNGVVHADKLYLRAPGDPQELPIKFMASSNRSLDVYDSQAGASSLVNYISLNFTNVSNVGVTAYDTKISAADFTVAVRSFSIENTPTDIDVYTMHDLNATKTSSPYYQPSPDFVAYVQSGTWWVRARYLDAKFTKAGAGPVAADRFNIRLQLLVYKELITKNVATPTPGAGLDLGGTNGSTSVIPTPTGF